jgi:hypothetical protein
MPDEDRERLERLLLMLDPDLYNKIYIPFREGDKSLFEIVLDLKKKERKRILQILDEPGRRRIQAQEEKSLKSYNLSLTAEILEVPRQTVYYWIKKGWVNPKRNSRGYPVFTVFDIEKILKWRDQLNFDRSIVKFKKNRRFEQHSVNINK